MEAKELRQLNPTELGTKVKLWQEELFRARIKGKTSELKDTSVFGKLRKDIARAKTVLAEQSRAVGAVETPQVKVVVSSDVSTEVPKKEKKIKEGKKVASTKERKK